MQNKTDLRKEIKQARKNIPDPDKLSRRIADKIRKSDIYNKANHVLLFYPMKYEINLLTLLEDNKIFYFPKVNGEDLLVCPAGPEYKKSNFGIYEPCSNPVPPEIIDIAIVPALAVDKDNYRLGYGGGFYDRFLYKYPKIKTLVPIQSLFVYNQLPHDENDIPVNYVITE